MLSFWSATIMLFLTSVGFCGLNVVQSYAIVNLENDDFPFQLYKTFLGCACFFLYGLATGENFREQFAFAFLEDMRTFVFCSFCLSCVEIGIILSLDWIGPSLFAIGMACTGPMAYLMSYIIGLETFIPFKLLGTLIAVGAACFAVLMGEQDKARKLIPGTIALLITVITMAGYYISQKNLYPKYTVTFVTATTLFAACVPLVFICGLTSTWSINWNDTNHETLYCLLYSGIVGQFLLYLTSNSANLVLSCSMVCLFGGLQPCITPWLDLLRTCYFDQVKKEDRSCASPSIDILLAGAGVLLGLGLYSLGEQTIVKNNMRRLSEAASFHSQRYEERRLTASQNRTLIESVNSLFTSQLSHLSEDEFIKSSNVTSNGNIYSSLHSSNFSYTKPATTATEGREYV